MWENILGQAIGSFIGVLAGAGFTVLFGYIKDRFRQSPLKQAKKILKNYIIYYLDKNTKSLSNLMNNLEKDQQYIIHNFLKKRDMLFPGGEIPGSSLSHLSSLAGKKQNFNEEDFRETLRSINKKLKTTIYDKELWEYIQEC